MIFDGFGHFSREGEREGGLRERERESSTVMNGGVISTSAGERRAVGFRL